VSTWLTARASHANGNCVEVACEPDGTVAVRDSKDPGGPVLRFTPSEWEAFTEGVRKHELDYWRLRLAGAH
jgi:predicted secreted Zn-dependent protease